MNFICLELHITPVLEIAPQQQIYEGDQLAITCSVDGSQYSTESVNLFLNRGTEILKRGVNKVNHSIVVLASDPAKFECELELGKLVKATSKTISVTGELTGMVEDWFRGVIGEIWTYFLFRKKKCNILLNPTASSGNSATLSEHTF